MAGATKITSEDLRARSVTLRIRGRGVSISFAHGLDKQHDPIVDVRHYTSDEFPTALSDLKRWWTERYGR